MFQKSAEEKYPVGPWLLALFVFVVCGSGKCRFDDVMVYSHSVGVGPTSGKTHYNSPQGTFPAPGKWYPSHFSGHVAVPVAAECEYTITYQKNLVRNLLFMKQTKLNSIVPYKMVVKSADNLILTLLTLISVYLQLYSRYFRALGWHSSEM